MISICITYVFHYLLINFINKTGSKRYMAKNLIDIIKDSPAIVAPFAALGTGTVLYVLNNVLYDNTIGLDYCVAASSWMVGAFLPNKSQKIASLVTFATTLSPELTAFCSSQEPTGGEA